ncbi:MAG: MFS transporter [Janthinobacterium lividum]
MKRRWSAYWALIPIIVPGKAVGTASGLMHGLGNLSGVVAPSLTGFIIERTHSYTAAFDIAGGLALLGALAVAFLIRDRAPTLTPSTAAKDVRESSNAMAQVRDPS